MIMMIIIMITIIIIIMIIMIMILFPTAGTLELAKMPMSLSALKEESATSLQALFHWPLNG